MAVWVSRYQFFSVKQYQIIVWIHLTKTEKTTLPTPALYYTYYNHHVSISKLAFKKTRTTKKRFQQRDVLCWFSSYDQPYQIVNLLWSNLKEQENGLLKSLYVMDVSMSWTALGSVAPSFISGELDDWWTPYSNLSVEQAQEEHIYRQGETFKGGAISSCWTFKNNLL